MDHGIRGARILCAVDSYVVDQIRARRPRSARALHNIELIDALTALGAEVELFGVDERNADICAVLGSAKRDLVFNLALSGTVREFHFIALLELLSLRYTGSDPATIMLCRNKFACLQVLAATGISVPKRALITSPRTIPACLRMPVILKPSVGTGSRGIGRKSIIYRLASLHGQIKSTLRKFDLPVVAEEFVAGREFRVSAVESKRHQFEVVSISESVFPKCYHGFGIMTGALKRHWMVQHVKKGIKVRPARLTASLTEQIYKTSLRSLQILGVEGYAALDIRMNDAGELFVIDVNPNPNLRKVGISWSRPSFEENVKRIVLAGLRRQSHLPRN